MEKEILQKNDFNLEEFLEEVSENDNYLNVFSLISSNEKKYKETNFYKENRLKLKDLVFDYKKWKSMNSLTLSNIQKIVNNLDVTHLEELLNDFSGIVDTENEELRKGFLQAVEIANLLQPK